LIRRIGREFPIDEIRRRPCVHITSRGYDRSAAGSPITLTFAHQPCDAPITHPNAFVLEFGLHTWSTICRSRPSIDRLDTIAKNKIRLRAIRRFSLAPSIKATLGYFEYTAEHSDRVFGLVSSHESEDFFEIVSASRANQAAAFDSISCSSLSRLFSRRSCVSSVRSLDVRTSRVDRNRPHLA